MTTLRLSYAFGLGLVFCGAPIVAAAADTAIQSIADATSGLPLPHPVGVVQVGEEVLLDLTYTNRTASEQVLGQVRSDCPCASPLAYPARVGPGETVTISVAYRADTPGPIAVRIELAADDKTAPWAGFVLGGAVGDAAWLVAPAALSTAAFANAALIDLRDVEEFARVRLPRSFPMQAQALARRTDLRDRLLVVVDSGLDPTATLLAVAEMRAAGFRSVYGLDGGLSAWMRAGLPVDGVATSVVEAASLTPVEFDRTRLNQPWHVHHMPGGRVGETLSQIASAEMDTSAPWLLIAEDVNDYARIERELPPPFLGRVRYLAGGVSAWASHEQLVQALASSTGERLEVRSSQSRPSGVSGCRSCP